MKLSLKVPPIALGIITLLLVWLIHRYVPIYRVKFVYQNLTAIVISGTGFIIGLLEIFVFKKLKTTVDPRHPQKASKLVIIGIYKYSRNPMYFGMLLAIIGFVIYLGSLAGIIIVVFFVLFINKYQIHPEEIVLQRKFGDNYSNYSKNVRSWI